MSRLLEESSRWLDRLAGFQEAVYQAVRTGDSTPAARRRVAFQRGGDTIYGIDTEVEPILLQYANAWADAAPLVLIAEGLGQTGKRVLPEGTPEDEASVVVLVDPIDGTRNLMYDKRSAWCLTGVAEYRGQATRLSDICISMMTELPASKQTVRDRLWAVRGQGATGRRIDADGNETVLSLRPSRATTLEHGFAAVSSFFPGTKSAAAALMEWIAARTTEQNDVSHPLVFDDQYISTGGQLYELMIGHDRFICDMRSLFYDLTGRPKKHCCHPYDLAGVLIAQEAGIELTDGRGGPLDAPLNVEHPVDWAGFANRELRKLIEPVMIAWIEKQRRDNANGKNQAP